MNILPLPSLLNMIIAFSGWWVDDQWVRVFVVMWSVIGWSVVGGWVISERWVGGSVFGGFNKTHGINGVQWKGYNGVHCKSKVIRGTWDRLEWGTNSEYNSKKDTVKKQKDAKLEEPRASRSTGISEKIPLMHTRISDQLDKWLQEKGLST